MAGIKRRFTIFSALNFKFQYLLTNYLFHFYKSTFSKKLSVLDYEIKNLFPFKKETLRINLRTIKNSKYLI